MGAAGMYALLALYLRRTETLRNLAYTQSAVGTLLFTIALTMLFHHETLQFVIAAEALTLHLIARRLSDRRIAFGGHILYAIIGGYLLLRLAYEPAETPAFFNTPSLVDLWTIACITASSFVWSKKPVRQIYLPAGAVCLALLFRREFEGDLLFFLLTVETAGFFALAQILKDETIDIFSHIFWGVIAVMLANRMSTMRSVDPAFFNTPSLVDLWTIACITASAFIWNKKPARQIYLLAATAFLALLFRREFEGNLLFFLLTVEAAGFFALAQILKDEALEVFSHIFWGGIAFMLADRMYTMRSVDPAFFNLEAAVNLVAMIAVAAASFRVSGSQLRLVYRLAVHVGLLAWLGRELLPFDDGQGYISVAWGAYGAILLIVGLRRNVHAVRVVGLGTLMLVVAKLFVVDLARLETIWRVLLFVGFGGGFLALSYYFPKLWKKSPEV